MSTSKISVLEKGQVEQSNAGQRRTEIRVIKVEQNENLGTDSLAQLVAVYKKKFLEKAYRGIARFRRESQCVSCES